MNSPPQEPSSGAPRPRSPDYCHEVLDSAPLFIWAIEGAEIAFANRFCLDFFGVDLDTIRTTEWSDLIHPDDGAHVLAACNKAIEQREALSIECRLRRADGQFRSVDLSIAPIAGDVVAGYCLDITERRQAERINAHDLQVMAELQKLNALTADGNTLGPVLAQVLDAAVAIAGSDFGNIQLVDPATGELRIVAQRGFTPEWVEFWNARGAAGGTCGEARTSAAQVVVEDVESSTFAADAAVAGQCRKAGVRAAVSTPLISRTGVLAGVISTHYRVPCRPGERELRLLGLLASEAAGIVEHADAMGVLREREELFRSIFSHAGTGIAISNLEGRLEEANPAFCELVGHDVEQLRQMSFESIIHPDDVPGNMAMVRRMLSGECQSFEIENRYVHRSGEPIWVRKFLSLLPGKNGEPAHMIALVTSMDERKRHEDDLRRLNSELADRSHRLEEEMKLRGEAQAALLHSQKMEALGQLSGGIAHDFNNLLTAIANYLESARETLPDGFASEAIRHALDAIEAGASLNRRLLAFARRGVLSPQRIVLNDRVSEMSRMLRETLGDHIEIETSLDRGLWPVLADQGEIDAAIVNIALNARDAMPGGGKLRIVTSRARRAPGGAGDTSAQPEDFACLEMTDTGSGMPAEVLRRAFEPFFTTKEVGQGTGLGLSTVYGIARQSGGFAEIESEPGRGTTVRLCLPRAAGGAVAAGSAGSPQGTPKGNGELILLVDDNEAVRRSTRFLIESLGYEVLEAASGPEAVEILKALEAIKLVASDVVMPGGMSGIDLAEWVRAHKPELGVLLLSGNDSAFAERAPQSGVTLLAKPYSRDSLARAIRESIAP